jgi:hypothetical protein
MNALGGGTPETSSHAGHGSQQLEKAKGRKSFFPPLLNLALTSRVMPMIPINDFSNSLVFCAGRRLQKRENPQRAGFLITAIMTGLMLMNHETAAQQAARTSRDSELTCNINGIPPQERARYGRLVEALRHAIKERHELPAGYAFQMDTRQIDTTQLVQWIELERLCCPFFGFQVLWERQNGAVWLHLTGPEGVKDFILDEFGLR